MAFKKTVLFLLCYCIAILTYAVPDSVTLNESDSSAIQLKVAQYDRLIKRYRYDNLDSATYYVVQGLNFAKRHHYNNGIALMLNQSGMIDDNLGDPEKSRPKYLEALSIYKQTGYAKGIAAVTIRLGVVELRKGNYDNAISYFLEALKVSEKDGNTYGIMEANLNLGEAYRGQRKLDKALDYLKIAEQLNEKLPFSNLSLNIYSSLGILYREKSDYAKATFYLEKGIRLSSAPEFQGLNITLINNLASVYAKQGFKEKAIELRKTALRRSREIRNYLREIQTLSGLASSYGKENPKEAIAYYEQALDLAREKKARRQEITILGELADIYNHLGNYREAYQHKAREHALADSVFYRSMSKKIDNLQAEYELAESQAKVRELNHITSQQRLKEKIILTVTIGVVMLFLIVAFYYSKTRSLNRLLNKTVAELNESDKIKDKIFSVLAHDLRSPFTSIVGYLNYIEEDKGLSEKEKKEMLHQLLVSSNATLGMLNNLLKWGEMQIKGVRLNQVDLNPKELIDRAIVLLADSAKKKSITISNKVDEAISVYADVDHVEFVVRNLLSNAIKFTPSGGSISFSNANVNADNVAFVVQDSGVGISSNRIKNIFRIDNMSTSGTNEEKGSSLGLVLCKEYIEANQGSIEVKSQIGKGSEFIFSLRRSTPASKHQELDKHSSKLMTEARPFYND